MPPSGTSAPVALPLGRALPLGCCGERSVGWTRKWPGDTRRWLYGPGVPSAFSLPATRGEGEALAACRLCSACSASACGRAFVMRWRHDRQMGRSVLTNAHHVRQQHDAPAAAGPTAAWRRGPRLGARRRPEGWGCPAAQLPVAGSHPGGPWGWVRRRQRRRRGGCHRLPSVAPAPAAVRAPRPASCLARGTALAAVLDGRGRGAGCKLGGAARGRVLCGRRQGFQAHGCESLNRPRRKRVLHFFEPMQRLASFLGGSSRADRAL